MDNEYKVSWIDTNPQNLSMPEQYVLKKQNKKHGRKENSKDMYKKVASRTSNKYLSKYELKAMLNFVLKSLPYFSMDELLLQNNNGFASYLYGK